MITLKLKPWVVIGGLSHIATSWQVATDDGFTNILDDVVESTEFVGIYYSNVVIPAGVTYFIRAMRHFSDTSHTDWSPAIPVIAKVDDSQLLLTKEVIIETPMLYVDPVTLLDNNVAEFIIETSIFKSTSEGHHATHWIIKDGSGKIIYCNLNDTVNLTSVTINKNDVSLYNKSQIKIIAMHVTATGIVSDTAIKTISLVNEHYNYEILNGDMQRVIPYTDYLIDLAKINPVLDYGVNRVIVSNILDGGIVYDKIIAVTDNSVLVPADVLAPDTTYEVVLLGLNTNGIYTNATYLLKTINVNEFENVDSNFVYKEEINFLYEESINYPSGVVTYEWHSGIIPMVKTGDNYVSKYVYNRITNRPQLVGAYNNIVITPTQVNDVYIRLLENNHIVVDRINGSGIPVFDIYTHNPTTDDVQFLHTIARVDETVSLGRTNAIQFIDINTAIYLVGGTNIVKKVNFVTQVIETLTTVPLTNIGFGTIINMNNGKLMFVGGSDDYAQVYDIDDDVWVAGPVLPIPFRNHSLQSVKLINNDTAIFRTNYVVGDDNDMLFYHIGSDTIDVVDVPALNNAATNSNITLRTGDVLRMSQDPDTNTTLVYELL